VTVFSYGIPFIKQYDPDGNTCLSHRYKFRMPEYDETTSDVRQLFAAYDNELDNGTWRTAPSDRQFTVIGRGETCKDSIEAAYKVLDGFNLPTCTWRDDVGHNFEQCELDLKKHRIV
jgi:phosphoribosylamine-glycine ligase